MSRYHVLSSSVGICAWVLTASLAFAQDTVPVTPQSPAPPSQRPLEPTAMEATPTSSPDSDFVMRGPEPMVDETRRLVFPNRPLVITGSSVFLGSYLPAVIYEATQDRNRNLYVPVAGPWLDFARGSDGQGARTLLAIDGALQGIGAFGLLLGFMVPEERTRNWYLIGGRNRALHIAPTRVARSGYGLLAQGTF